MKIKLDENLGHRGAEILRAAGYSVTTVVEEGLSSASDGRLIEVCRSEGKCLVTLDLDCGDTEIVGIVIGTISRCPRGPPKCSTFPKASGEQSRRRA